MIYSSETHPFLDKMKLSLTFCACVIPCDKLDGQAFNVACACIPQTRGALMLHECMREIGRVCVV